MRIAMDAIALWGLLMIVWALCEIADAIAKGG